MDLSSPHLLRDFLGALLSLPVQFYNVAVGILAIILASCIPTLNTLNISEGGLKFFTDSPKLLSPALIIPATLIAAIFLFTRSREGYDGIQNMLSTVPAILHHTVSAPGFALVAEVFTVVFEILAEVFTGVLVILAEVFTGLLVILAEVFTVVLVILAEVFPGVLVILAEVFTVVLLILAEVFTGVPKILAEVGKILAAELKPILEVLAVHHALPQILVFLFLTAVLHHFYN
ncbi:hypothetical protein QBC34DRAFT_383009 [Podospora aff. communis PSN243]|uniref:Uncharacterized protein n=1 Tax=Podospora aff. communis PSN243 TaxID=3040156 RepID=A0AAV9GEL1_9PEZI|nr:hypothetical protein QBC34DRAFT_383009 [Podospora aff. communis PSN243]